MPYRESRESAWWGQVDDARSETVIAEEDGHPGASAADGGHFIGRVEPLERTPRLTPCLPSVGHAVREHLAAHGRRSDAPQRGMRVRFPRLAAACPNDNTVLIHEQSDPKRIEVGRDGLHVWSDDLSAKVTLPQGHDLRFILAETDQGRRQILGMSQPLLERGTATH